MKRQIITIKSGADNAIENADSSSGEEDDRVKIYQAKPMKIVHICKEEVDGKSELVCYIKFSNWEILRYRNSIIAKKVPHMIQEYYEKRIKAEVIF